MRKRVLVFLQSGVGGAERVTVTVGKNLDVNRYEVIFCILDRPIGKITIESFIPQIFKRTYIPKVSGLKLLLALRKVIAQEKPDIIFSSMMFVNTKLLALSWLYPEIKFVVRNNNYLYTLSKFQKFILKFTYRFADKIITQTDEMKDELVSLMHLKDDKVETISNPLDIQTIEEKIKESSPYGRNSSLKFVASGRFFQVKGFDILVQAFKLVHEKMENTELYIVGNTTGNCSSYYNEIKKLISCFQLENVVHCVGFQMNPYVYVQNADCFVLSSRNEGLPNVLIEALFLGTPCAATKCIPIISRIIEEGKTGFLAESENPESLATAMQRAVSLGRVSSRYIFDTSKSFESLFDRI